ncbi:MAG TPA: polyprenyl synthetase family protein [Thermoanaerobaculia bacterium]|nr:polyprenyl synthetase family protein [Thermoanaerobaculia bacterium]
MTAFLAAKRAAAAAGLAEPGGRAERTAAGELPGAAPHALPKELLEDLPEDLIDGLGRLMTQGGKRLRPALVYYTYRACGGRSDRQVLPLALAVEFLHTYLLIHDDIMDHAEVRRGQPAAHARFRDLHRAGGLRGDADDFGRSVAILLGDLAHTYAVDLFTGVAVRPGGADSPEAGQLPPRPGPPAPHWIELDRCFSVMCEEVIAGQYLEYLLAHRRYDGRPASGPSAAGAGAPDASPAGLALAPRESELLRVLRLKSGRYTAERPIQLGALLAGAPAELRAELSRYGTAVGEAFQLQDDLLGMFGDPETVGKPVGDDLREGKFTLLIHHALVNGAAADRQRVADALGDPDLSAAAVAQVQETLERTGARRAVTGMIAQRLEEARHALDKAAPLLASAAPIPASAAPVPAPGGTAAGQEHPGRPEAAEGLRFLAGLLDYLWEREQ